jgi:hypothetical protein
LDAVELAEETLGDDFFDVGRKLLVGGGLGLADTEVDGEFSISGGVGVVLVGDGEGEVVSLAEVT